MASKKEKHAKMLAKRAAREAAVADVGRKALEADRQRRKVEEARMWEDAHKTHLKRNRFHPDCEHCNKIKAQQAMAKLTKAAELTKAGVSDVDNPHKELTEEEARIMDEESVERIKGVLQEMGAINLTRVEKVSA